MDSIFVAKISEDALTAVTLAFPIQTLMIAAGSGTGVGINALLSKSLGEKNFDRSDAAANTGILLNFFNYLLFLMIGIFLAKPFISSQTSNDVIIEYGATYVAYVCMFSIGIFAQMTFERLLQATGRTLLSMVSQMTGAIINIIMDPLLIFGIGPFPKLGVAGAAIATIFGQTVAASLGIFMNIKYNKDIRLSLSKVLHPKKEIVKAIYVVGVPSILMVSVGSVMTYAFNKILNGFSTTAVAVFGVYFKLQSFFFMPVFGLNNGLIPVLAYNYGARKKARISEALHFAVRLAFCIMLCGMLIFEMIPTVLLDLFDASDHMIDIGVPALRLIAIHFPIASVCIVLGSVFQAFAKSYYSLVVSLGRQLFVLIPVAYGLSLFGKVSLVWLSFPIAECISLTLTLVFYRKIRRDILDKMA